MITFKQKLTAKVYLEQIVLIDMSSQTRQGLST